MSQTNFTPISIYYSTTASAVPTAANLVQGELAINTNDGKLYYEDSSGVVQTLASKAGALGDVVGPASATDNALVRFDLTTGKLIQNSIGILTDAGALSGLTGLTSSGSITLSSLTSGRVTFAGASGLLSDSSTLTYDGTTLTASTGANFATTSGSVGIGITSPTAKLQLGDGSSGQLKFRIHRGSGTDYSEYFSDTGSTIVDTVGGGSFILRFGGTEKLQVTASGNVFVGTSTAFDSAYTMSLRVYNATGGLVIKPDTDNYTPVSFRNAANTQVGSISATSSATAYNTSSDYRLKENIAPMTGALATVAQLKPVTYKWKIDGSDGQGFIAHELAEVVPDCVSGEKDAIYEDGSIKPQGVDTSFLVATLTAAIQEQQALIESLTTRLTALENK